MSDSKYIQMQKKIKELQNLFSWSEFYRNRKHLKTHKQVTETQARISEVKKEINELKKKR